MFCGLENLKVINLEWKDWELVTLAWVKGKLEICHFRTRSARARFPQAPQLWRVVFGSILYCKDTFSIPVFNMAGFRSTLLGFNVVKNGILRFTWHFHKGTSFLIIVIFIFLKRKHLIIVFPLLVGDLFNSTKALPLENSWKMIHAFRTLCFRRKRDYWIGKKLFVYQYCPYILLSDIIRFPMFLFAYVNLNCLFPTHQFRWLKRSSISSANVLLTQLWATKQNTRWFDMSRVFMTEVI